MPILITNNFPPERGGIQRVISRVAGECAARGGEVIVVAPGLPGSREIDEELPFRVIRYRVVRQKFAGMLAMLVAFLKARRVARGHATIASVWWPVGVAVALVPRFLRGRFAVMAHGSEIAPERTGFRRRAMRFVYARADVVIANSGFTEALLAKVGVKGNVRVVLPGVDMRDVAITRASQPTVLSVGRLQDRKGFDRVIEAVARLVPAFPTLRYEIIGDGPQLDALRDLARALHIESRVNFLGAVSDRELWEAYGRAWCFALPVRTVGDDVEGFGIVYLEAALAELAAVGGKGSGAAEAIVDGATGLLVDGNSVAAVSEALNTLLNDRTLADEMGRQGRERALKLSWARTTDEILYLLPAKHELA